MIQVNAKREAQDTCESSCCLFHFDVLRFWMYLEFVDVYRRIWWLAIASPQNRLTMEL